MKLEYLTRTEGIAPFGTRVGIAGVGRALLDGRVVNEVDIVLWVDFGGEGPGSEGFTVGTLYTPRVKDAVVTLAVLGDDAARHFATFQDALAFCLAFARHVIDVNIQEGLVETTIAKRGMFGLQYLPDEHTDVASEVALDAAPSRVLH
jgi:hypothetical protein